MANIENSAQQEYELLTEEDVISAGETDAIRVGHLMSNPTFKVDEFTAALKTALEASRDVNLDWLIDGLECRVLVPGKLWRKGKIELRLVFSTEFETGDRVEPEETDLFFPPTPKSDR